MTTYTSSIHAVEKEYLPEETLKVQVDNVSLTKQCYMLMKKFRLDIKMTLKIEHSIMGLNGDSLQPLYPQITMKILKKERDVQSVGWQINDPIPQSLQLEVVTQILKKYLDFKALVAAYSS